MKFQEPPVAASGRRRRHVTPDIEAELIAHPGQWALVAENESRATMSAITQWARRNDAFEATARSTKDGFDVYLRYREIF